MSRACSHWPLEHEEIALGVEPSCERTPVVQQHLVRHLGKAAARVFARRHEPRVGQGIDEPRFVGVEAGVQKTAAYGLALLLHERELQREQAPDRVEVGGMGCKRSASAVSAWATSTISVLSASLSTPSPRACMRCHRSIM